MRKPTSSPKTTAIYGGEAEGDMFVAELSNGAVRIGFKGRGPFFNSNSPAFETARYAATFAKSQAEIDEIAGKALESLKTVEA